MDSLMIMPLIAPNLYTNISVFEEPAAPVWVGAKKFSMKDRYETTVMSSEQISKILPHRYPFLLVDRVVEFEAGKFFLFPSCHSSLPLAILNQQ